MLDGSVYQADTMFCVDPDCPCTEGRLSMLAVSARGSELVEVASARLTLEAMTPDEFVGERTQRETFTRLYLEWRRRHVAADARFRELRDATRRRGLELHEALSAQSKRRALVPPVQGAPGRNAPCPCGSGKKFKRCCAG